jgi:uncharacterized membrane protein
MTVTRRAPMNPILLSLTCAVLGMAGAVLTGSFGLGAAAMVLLLAAPLVLRGDRLAALAGLLLGFGGMWLLLLASQAAAGGNLDDPKGWVLIGAAPLVIGSLALMLRLYRTLRRVTSPHAD